LAVSFVIAGLFVATIGYSIGLDGGALRYVAAALITAMGAVLILPSLQARLALASGPIAGWTNRHVPRVRAGGLFGQFGIGVLLGVVWSPCVGPTLGAASLLAGGGALR
jgi:cytochrome c-type biogenesis protein